MKIDLVANIDVEALARTALNTAIQKEISSRIKSLKFEGRTLNTAVQREVSAQIKSLKFEERMHKEMGSKIEHFFKNTDVYGKLAKEISKQIDVEKIIEKIDLEKIADLTAEKLAIKMMSKLK